MDLSNSFARFGRAKAPDAAPLAVPTGLMSLGISMSCTISGDITNRQPAVNRLVAGSIRPGEPRQFKYLAQSGFYSFTRSGTLLARKRELVRALMSTQAASNRIFRHSPI